MSRESACSARIAAAVSLALVMVAGAGSADASTLPASPAWTVSRSPSPDPVNSALEAVSARTTSDVWAVGYGYTTDATLAKHWDGSSWTVVPTPNPPSQFDGILFGVSADAASDAWAVGFSDHLNGESAIAEHWNRQRWTLVATPQPGAGGLDEFHGVVALAPNNVWAVGAYRTGSLVLKSLVEHYDGTSWRVVSSPSPGSSQTVLTGIAALSPTDMWAVGYEDTSPIALHWDGTSWTRVATPIEATGVDDWLNSVAAISTNDVWAVGLGAQGSLIEHWNGTSWRIVASPVIQNELSTVAGVSAGSVWAVSQRTGFPVPLIEHFDGRSWRVVTPARVPGSDELIGVAAAGGQAWAVGDSILGQMKTLVERIQPVRVTDAGFDRVGPRVHLGSTAVWEVDPSAAKSHTLVSGNLFQSPTLTAGQSFGYAFPIAGWFEVADTTTQTSQLVSVPPSGWPLRGSTATTFHVQWATTAAASGSSFEVEIMRPGTFTFQTWKPAGTTALSATFTADGGSGTYIFRSRATSPFSTSFSPDLVITVS
jgi:hypothetical protein